MCKNYHSQPAWVQEGKVLLTPIHDNIFHLTDQGKTLGVIIFLDSGSQKSCLSVSWTKCPALSWINTLSEMQQLVHGLGTMDDSEWVTSGCHKWGSTGLHSKHSDLQCLHRLLRCRSWKHTKKVCQYNYLGRCHGLI